ncbi:uncharacterized protein LOC131239111 [Magnolia sinica]|uniref:uncharacterized protein LOC131239111 n=1 Tax=Magnolia sinica TaxID=86752 RepID=UPI00265AF83A|nr:uncharacterized protein LOC131239111 [Magnolia sinica]
MKIFSKIMMSRLAIVLPKLISKQQGAFVKGRSIVENISIAREMVHEIDHKAFRGNLIIKVDMEKAYDRLDWGFIIQVLQKFGFARRWISMVQRCWEGIWFSALINGRSFGFFKSSRGLRISNVRSLLSLIQQYERALGQKLNTSKTSFIVPTKTPRTRSNKLSALTSYKQAFLPSTYLSVPLAKGRIPAALCHQVLHKIIGKIDGWKAKLLNSAAKLVLIKHVLSSIPIHMISAISLSKLVLKLVESAMANFFWGSSDRGNKRHLVKWPSLCSPYSEGGLGIRYLEETTRAFRIKMAWQLLQGDSLWASLFSVKYFEKLMLLNGLNGSAISHG